MVDIIKTGFDIFERATGYMTRIVGTFALGSILIYIFYAFTSEKEEKK